MKSNEERMHYLNVITGMRPSYETAIEELKKYEWDFDGNPILLSRSVFKNVLMLYIEGKSTADQVIEWADFLELREDVDFLESDEAVLSEILHVLANPDLELHLTPDRAQQIISKL